MKTRSWSWSVGIMLVPSTLTGWYRKMIKNAETASEMSTSRSQPESMVFSRRECTRKTDGLSSGVELIALFRRIAFQYSLRLWQREIGHLGNLRDFARIHRQRS